MLILYQPKRTTTALSSPYNNSVVCNNHLTAVKNCICAVSEAMGTDDPTTAESIYAERNKGAYVMGEDSMDIDNLLSRSQSLAQSKRKDGDT